MSRGRPRGATKGAAKLPPHLRFHVVPRDLRWSLPQGWEWCGPMVVGALRSATRKLILSWDLWPEEVQDWMDGMVVVSAVAATLEPETIFPWGTFWDERPRADRIHPRDPRLLQFPRGHALRVTMAQCRQGGAVGLASTTGQLATPTTAPMSSY